MSQSRSSLRSLYAVECLSSLGTTLLQVAIFFYTKHRFGWSTPRNLTFAACIGAFYVIGALLAGSIAARFGRRAALTACCLLLGTLAALALLPQSATGFVVVLLVYTVICGAHWPIVESLVTSGTGDLEMSRRVGVYNLVWSAAGAVAFAANGTLIEHWPAGVLLVPVMAHGASALILLLIVWAPWRASVPSPRQPADDHPHAEAALLQSRRLALWLSRISLPATYVVISGLSAILPSLPSTANLSTDARTLVSSVWLLARTVAFALLGVSIWWHTRPRMLLAAAVLMLISFLGVVGSPLAGMVLWQIALGVALGMIYCGSLYFGMVLSSGSTEHGGYHEALIGLGSVLGPGLGAVAQWMWPNGPLAGIIVIASITAASVIVSAAIAIRPLPRRRSTC